VTSQQHDHHARPPGEFTGRAGFGRATGISVGPYRSFNLGYDIGDDPEAVRANRCTLTAELGLEPDHLVFMSQVHGTNVVHVTGSQATAVPETDAMVTATPGLGLAVMVADCVPVLARDERTGVIGVAHAGRLGAAAGIVPALIAAMVDLDARPDDLQVLLGPAICGRCYEVPAPMCREVDAQLPGSACVTAEGTAGLDLRAGLTRQLQGLGIFAVRVDGRCTKDDPDLFSHRGSAPTGRFAGVVRLPLPDPRG
jgi:YfiH family protein